MFYFGGVCYEVEQSEIPSRHFHMTLFQVYTSLQIR